MLENRIAFLLFWEFLRKLVYEFPFVVFVLLELEVFLRIRHGGIFNHKHKKITISFKLIFYFYSNANMQYILGFLNNSATSTLFFIFFYFRLNIITNGCRDSFSFFNFFNHLMNWLFNHLFHNFYDDSLFGFLLNGWDWLNVCLIWCRLWCDRIGIGYDTFMIFLEIFKFLYSNWQNTELEFNLPYWWNYLSPSIQLQSHHYRRLLFQPVRLLYQIPLRHHHYLHKLLIHRLLYCLNRLHFQWFQVYYSKYCCQTWHSIDPMESFENKIQVNGKKKKNKNKFTKSPRMNLGPDLVQSMLTQSDQWQLWNRVFS